VKDHLGNVRSVIDVHTFPVQEFLGSYEIGSAHIEGVYFDQHNEIRDLNPSSTDPDNLHSGRLNAADSGRQTGTAMLVHVMAGDQIELNVNNFYEEYDPNNDHPITPSDLVDGLVTVLTRGDGGYSGSESSDKILLGDVLTALNPADLADVLEASWDPNKPKAWLTYLLFDERMQLVPEGCKSFQVNGGGSWGQIGTEYPVVIPANGYLAVFLHTATVDGQCHHCGDVYFDQLLFRFTRGKLKEETHYYPHGLPITALSSIASGHKESRHKHQGNEFNKGLGLNWMDFHNRQYDPQIGRFLGVDPLAAATKSFSSYAAMNNNPASTVDPLGLTGIEIISWVDYAPTRMDQLLMLSPAQMMDQLGITDELRNYNEQMVAAAREREQMRETRQQAAIQAWTGQSPFSSGNTACNKFLTDGPSANEVYGVGGGSSDGDIAGDSNKGGKKAPMGPFTSDEVDNALVESDPSDPATQGKNLLGTNYLGPNNPKTKSGDWDYKPNPKNRADANGLIHDKAYDKLRIVGASGLFFSTSAIPADSRFVAAQLSLTFSKDATLSERVQASVSGNALGAAMMPKVGYNLISTGFQSFQSWMSMTVGTYNYLPIILRK
jgi:RHS repeat-associated protein